MRASASLLALAMLVVAAAPAQGQSLVPVVVLTSSPVEQFVNITGESADAVFDCTVFVEGLPMVRYRVNLSASCEGWATRCDPAQFVITGMANQSFRAYITVPAGTPSTMQHQVEISASVSTTGVPLAANSTFCLVSVWPAYGLKLTTDTQRASVDAGKDVVWPFSLQNTGNGRDTFGITTVNPASFSGWSVVCNRSSVSVDTNASINLKYTIKPPADARNQTVILQMKAFSRGASFKNLTVEQKLELEISVNAVPSGGNGTKPPVRKNTPGFEAGAIPLVLALCALAAHRRRK